MVNLLKLVKLVSTTSYNNGGGLIVLKGNKGEWSEIYVLLRLLAQGKLFAADDKLNKLENIYFPIVKIIREEMKGEITEYWAGDFIRITINGEEAIRLPVHEFKKEADKLLTNLEGTGATGAFSLISTENFMTQIRCFKISAPAQDKTDIHMKIQDINTGYSPVVGFSIKSELGSSPTLLNAGRTTNFIYRVNYPNQSLLRETNDIYKTYGEKNHIDVKGRITNIYENGGSLEYRGMANEIFKENLEFIDSRMDVLIAETLLYFFRDNITRCSDMVKKLQEDNPFLFGNLSAYSYKFKKFLASVALGMKPATVWDGLDQATGGYIVVTKEGEVLAYHIYNRDYFEDYLLENTKFETASTNRHDFGKVYHQQDGDFINLNLQIRFI